MSKTLTKTLSLVLAIVMVLGLGAFNVLAEGNVAKIGDTEYQTLAEAIASVNDGETIEMIGNEDNAQGIAVPEGKNFTVDFKGYTYTVNKPGAGSQGTQTSAFQLLKNSNITFKNGTITVAQENKDFTWDSGATTKGIARLFQSYANLTLENMHINGENIAHNNNPVRELLSLANGTVAITGGSITAAEGDVALQVNCFSNYTGGRVTVTNTEINGGIDIYDESSSSVEERQLSLSLDGNTTVNGALTVTDESDETAGKMLVIKAPTIDLNAPTGYIWVNDGETKKLIQGTAVAEIDGTPYATLAEAVATANEGDTITLLTSIDATGQTLTLPDGVTLQGAEVEEGEEPITITNLAGFAASTKNLTVKNLKFVQTNTKLTMRGENVKYEGCYFTGTNNPLTTFENGKDFVFEECTFKGNRHGGINLIGNPSVTNLTFNKCELTDCWAALYYGYLYGNVVVKDTTIVAYAYVIHTGSGGTTGTVYDFDNVDIWGWFSYGNEVEQATFDKCKFHYQESGYNYMRPYRNSTFTDCKIEAGFKIDALEGLTHTVLNCYSVNGEQEILLTAANCKEAIVTKGDENDYAIEGKGTVLANAAVVNGKVYIDVDEAIDAAIAGVDADGIDNLFYVDPNAKLPEGYTAVLKSDGTYVIGKTTTEVQQQAGTTEDTVEFKVNTRTENGNDTLASVTDKTVTVSAASEVTTADDGSTQQAAPLNNVEKLADVVKEVVESAGTDAGSIDSIEISLYTSANEKGTEGEGEAAVTTYSFEVHPIATAYQTTGSVKTEVGSAKIGNEQLANDASFPVKLYIPATSAKFANAVHEKEDGTEEVFNNLPILHDGDKYYVQIVLSSFSTVIVTPDAANNDDFALNAVVVGKNLTTVGNASYYPVDANGSVSIALNLSSAIAADVTAADIYVQLPENLTYNSYTGKGSAEPLSNRVIAIHYNGGYSGTDSISFTESGTETIGTITATVGNYEYGTTFDVAFVPSPAGQRDANITTSSLTGGQISDMTYTPKLGDAGMIINTEWTVSFNTDGGTAVNSQKVGHMKTATAPTAPKKDGYTFVEWQKDSATYVFATAVTGDITLNAQWEETEYTINFVDVNDNSINTTPETKFTVNSDLSDGGYTIPMGYKLQKYVVKTSDIYEKDNTTSFTAGDEFTSLSQLAGKHGNVTLTVHFVVDSTMGAAAYRYGNIGENKRLDLLVVLVPELAADETVTLTEGGTTVDMYKSTNSFYKAVVDADDNQAVYVYLVENAYDADGTNHKLSSTITADMIGTRKLTENETAPTLEPKTGDIKTPEGLGSEDHNVIGNMLVNRGYYSLTDLTVAQRLMADVAEVEGESQFGSTYDIDAIWTNMNTASTTP